MNDPNSHETQEQPARSAKGGVWSSGVRCCPAGHERTPENTYTYASVDRGFDGSKFKNVKCKICTKAKVRASRAAGYIRKE
jgi:hypothetical protein